MSSLYVRLRALLPNPPVLLARVVSIDEDKGTSVLTIPGGVQTTAVSPELSTGATFTARGTSVEVDKLAIVRAGVIESQAPDGLIIEAVIGVVAADPNGPAELAVGAPIPAQTAVVGTPFNFSVMGAFVGGTPPLIYGLEAGTFPAGLVGNEIAGTITGTPTTPGVATLTLSARDSTGAFVVAAPFTLTVT